MKKTQEENKIKKTTQEICNEADINYNIVKENVFWIKWDDVIDKISKRECLLCNTNLDDDIGKGKWHIPLCKKHRMEEIEKKRQNENKMEEKSFWDRW